MLAVVAGIAYFYVPLETFNLFIPKDEGSRLLASDVAYGPDPRHRLDVYVPTVGLGPWPVVVFVHGGSWSSGNKNPYEFVGRALAAQGFVAMLPNYRLHPEHRYPAFVEDTALAIDWATRNAADYGGDPHKVFVSGHSAGAYNVSLAVLDKHYLAALGTDTSVIKGVVLLAGPLDFLPLDGPVSQDVFGQASDLPGTQPVHFVRPDAPPFLLLHGTEDLTCWPKNSISLDEKLRAAGASSRLILYQGVSHAGILLAFAKPLRSGTPALADIVAFFKSH